MSECEIIQSVFAINCDLFDQGWNDGEVQLEYMTDGYVTLVKFLGCNLYNSESDTWEEDFPTFENFIRTRVNELISFVKEIKV